MVLVHTKKKVGRCDLTKDGTRFVVVTDWDKPDVRPNPHKSMSEWGLELYIHGFRVNVNAVGHGPVLREQGAKEIVHFTGIRSSHNLSKMREGSTLYKSVAR